MLCDVSSTLGVRANVHVHHVKMIGKTHTEIASEGDLVGFHLRQATRVGVIVGIRFTTSNAAVYELCCSCKVELLSNRGTGAGTNERHCSGNVLMVWCPRFNTSYTMTLEYKAPLKKIIPMPARSACDAHVCRFPALVYALAATRQLVNKDCRAKWVALSVDLSAPHYSVSRKRSRHRVAFPNVLTCKYTNEAHLDDARSQEFQRSVSGIPFSSTFPVSDAVCKTMSSHVLKFHVEDVSFDPTRFATTTCSFQKYLSQCSESWSHVCLAGTRCDTSNVIHVLGCIFADSVSKGDCNICIKHIWVHPLARRQRVATLAFRQLIAHFTDDRIRNTASVPQSHGRMFVIPKESILGVHMSTCLSSDVLKFLLRMGFQTMTASDSTSYVYPLPEFYHDVTHMSRRSNCEAARNGSENAQGKQDDDDDDDDKGKQKRDTVLLHCERSDNEDEDEDEDEEREQMENAYTQTHGFDKWFAMARKQRDEDRENEACDHGMFVPIDFKLSEMSHMHAGALPELKTMLPTDKSEAARLAEFISRTSSVAYT